MEAMASPAEIGAGAATVLPEKVRRESKAEKLAAPGACRIMPKRRLFFPVVRLLPAICPGTVHCGRHPSLVVPYR